MLPCLLRILLDEKFYPEERKQKEISDELAIVNLEDADNGDGGEAIYSPEEIWKAKVKAIRRLQCAIRLYQWNPEKNIEMKNIRKMKKNRIKKKRMIRFVNSIKLQT